MAFNNVSLVYSYFADPEKSQAISEGDCYVGTPDLDANDIPQNQKQVYHRQEDGSDVPVSQPLQTGAGGVILINGSPAQIVVDGNYSLVVLDKSGAQKYYDPNRYDGEPVTVDSITSVGLGAVNTIADLRAYGVANLTGNERIYVSGYYASGDGGGDVFYWNATSTDSDDGGGTILPTSHTGAGRWKRIVNDALAAKGYGLVGDGATDDTVALQNLASQTDFTYIYFNDGTYVIGGPVVFAQNNLRIIFSRNAKILQAPNTQTIDTLIEFTGTSGVLTGFHADGNIANNVGYTGRNELVNISGDYWTTYDFVGRNVGTGGVATTLYVTGRWGRFNNTTTFDTGTNGVRDFGDYNEYVGLNMFEWGQHGFTKDSGYLGAASNYTLVSNVIAESSKDESDMEAILFDHDGVSGALCRVENVTIKAPNSNGPDAIKFAYMDRVEISNLWVEHKLVDTAAGRTSLRFQQEIKNVDIQDCVIAGALSFNPDVDCVLNIGGKSVLGANFEVSTAITGFRGKLSIEDGVQIFNLRNYAVSVDSAGFDTRVDIGRITMEGATGYTPGVINQDQLDVTGTIRRAVAGDITIGKPLSMEGTMRTLENDGRWITLNENRESAAAQAGDRVFLVASSDFPPRDVENWVRADVLRLRSPNAGQVVEKMCITAGASCQTAWTGSTVYAQGDWVFNGSNVYGCTTAGTSAASGGPTGTGTGITDGTCVWDYIAPRAVFADTVSTA